jgi:hypothetical protein
MVDSVETGLISRRYFIHVRYSITNNGLSSNNQFNSAAKVLEKLGLCSVFGQRARASTSLHSRRGVTSNSSQIPPLVEERGPISKHVKVWKEQNMIIGSQNDCAGKGQQLFTGLGGGGSVFAPIFISLVLITEIMWQKIRYSTITINNWLIFGQFIMILNYVSKDNFEKQWRVCGRIWSRPVLRYLLGIFITCQNIRYPSRIWTRNILTAK